MSSNPCCSLAELAAAIPDGAMLAVPADANGAAMAATRELVRRGARDLHVVCVPIGGLLVDLLIGSGAVATIETSAVSLGEYGPAPRFTAAVRERRIAIRDATCPAIHAGLQAAQKGIPFMPLRGLLGSDLLAHRSDWQVIDNPFAAGDPIVLVAAIRPDIALFHAARADRAGNVFIGRTRELLTLAHAARTTFVTVEEIVVGDLMADADAAPGVLPAIYVERIAVAPGGARPLALPGRYGADAAALARYAQAAQTAAGFRAFAAAWLATEPVAP